MCITLMLLFIAMQIHLLMASPFPGSPAKFLQSCTETWKQLHSPNKFDFSLQKIYLGLFLHVANQLFVCQGAIRRY